MLNTKTKKRGFTMIEAFVAITVLLIAVLGPLTLITRAIIDGNYAKYQVTASFLLQEGLDLAVARAAELSYANDISLLNGYDSTPCPTVNKCHIAYVGNAIIIYLNSSNSESDLYTDSNGVYTHASAGNTKTIFNRKIWFVDVLDGGSRPDGPVPGEDKLIGKKVFVQLDWSYRGVTRSQIATTIVYE